MVRFNTEIDYEKFMNILHDIYILYPSLYSYVLISTYLNISLREIMTRWILKGCPRCSGDLNLLQDEEGYYEDCLQCGYHRYFKENKVDIPQYSSFRDDAEFTSDLIEDWMNEYMLEV
jgi:DNA-directed RNA polymerase subunit RPC12/RpoP